MEHSELLFGMSSPWTELSVSVPDAKPFLFKRRHTWQQLFVITQKMFLMKQQVFDIYFKTVKQCQTHRYIDGHINF